MKDTGWTFQGYRVFESENAPNPIGIRHTGTPKERTMTTLYRPVQVLNDAQRAALPKGSFMHPNCHRGGILTYLVPIEAEEEYVAPDAITYSRYVTAWEEA